MKCYLMNNSSEIKELIISWMVISLCFAYNLDLMNFVFRLPIYLITAGIAFLAHELSHRFVARRMGYVARYKMWNWGLALALFSAIISGGRAIFSAPGAVYILYGGIYSWRDPKKDETLITAAGPLANIILSILFYGLSSGDGITSTVGYVGFALNSSIATYNLLPIPPLDGSKIFRGNMLLWIALMGASVCIILYA